MGHNLGILIGHSPFHQSTKSDLAFIEDPCLDLLTD